jgi:hypothetical protein
MMVCLRLQSLDIDRFRNLAAERREVFASALPFPHVVLENFLRPEVADAVVREFDHPGLEWKSYHHVNERKLVCGDLPRMGPVSRMAITDLQSPAFLRALAVLAGVQALCADPDLDGAGLQQTCDGGFLNVHVDHLAHARRRTWSRQLNLILYLNRDWDESNRGWLEFWDPQVACCVHRIAPVFNRCVIFRTSRISFHGVPSGVTCAADRSRKSIALYYFRDEGRVCPLQPTYYAPLPSDPPLKRAAIVVDRWLLAVYSLAKRYLGLSDATVSRLLRRF